MRLAKINAVIKISIYEEISKVTKLLTVFFKTTFHFALKTNLNVFSAFLENMKNGPDGLPHSSLLQLEKKKLRYYRFYYSLNLLFSH